MVLPTENRISYFCCKSIPLLKGREAFMKKIFSFFILFILVNLAANAQNEPLFSNYMLMRNITNPAFVGAGSTINAIFNNRTMFAGFGDGKPVTSVFGVEAPFEMLGARNGAGLTVVSDEIGFFTTVSVDGAYAYHRQLEGGTLGGGISVGFNSFSIEPQWVIPSDDDHFGSVDGDVLIPDQFNILTFSVGLGVYYETPRYYIGLSASKINRVDWTYTGSNQTEVVVGYDMPTYHLTGAYNIELPNPLFDLRPSFMLRSDFAAYMLDVNGTVYYQKKFWAGLGLRVSPANIAALTILGGVQLMNGLNIGYAMDLNTSAMIVGGATSHEVLVTYSFNLDTKRDQKYKSVRYL